VVETAYEHEAVMPTEVLEYLAPERGGCFLDGTVGGGGHAARILESGSEVRLLALDVDQEAIAAARDRLTEYADRVELVQANFRDADAVCKRAGWEGLKGALLDLGVSSRQIDERARGFSFRLGTPLKMRMGGTTGGREPAADLLNTASEHELGRVFREYGEERRWKALAREVVRKRRERPLTLSDHLIEALGVAYGRAPSAKQAARVFQAVRIAVNDELRALEQGLGGIRDLLMTGGRLVVISYHSLEDRIVKHTFRAWSQTCVCPPGLPECRCRGQAIGRVLTRKPLRPAASEVQSNARARSARLRAWERTEE
jgi:16S rRNA (cytosine1402-N4)-methyltransferase